MSDDAPTPDADAAAASDAFQALGNENRLAVIRALADAEAAPATFSELQEAVGADSSAGFAYHLRQLTDRFVEGTDEAYRLTEAGERVARAVAGGTLTERARRDRADLDEDCPHCGEPALSADVTGARLAVGCEACGTDLLALPLVPGADRSQDDVPAALDRRHRHRVAAMTDGACPDCGGAVSRTVERDGDGVRADLSCRTCGVRHRVPVALAVVDHPAAVALYHEHGVDVRERRTWELAEEWDEAVVSEEPLAVRVSTVVGEERLSLFVGHDLSVVHVERGHADETSGGRAAA